MVKWLYDWLFSIVHKNDEHVLVWNKGDVDDDLKAARSLCEQWVVDITRILDDEPEPPEKKVEFWDARADKYNIYVDWIGADNLRYWPTHVLITENGNWEGVPDWAKAFLVNFPEAGGATHMFGRCLDVDGNVLETKSFRLFWPDGEQGGTPEGSGWANFFTNARYDPSVTSGPYGLMPLNGVPVVGGGQPYGSPHVSIFTVWKARW